MRPGDDPPCPETGEYGELLCPRGDLNPETREISPIQGNFHGQSITSGARGRQAFRVPSRFPVGRWADVRAGLLQEAPDAASAVTLRAAPGAQAGEISTVRRGLVWYVR